MNDQDGLRIEAAEQFGFSEIGQDEFGHSGYQCTTAQLIAFAKACERAGMFQSHGMGSRDLVAKRIAEIDAELAPLLVAETKSASVTPLAKLHQRAMAAAQAYEDAASYEETQWTGWGDQVVPPSAEMRRVKAQQAVCALRDAQKVESGS